MQAFQVYKGKYINGNRMSMHIFHAERTNELSLEILLA
jgi:hypothetical protein